jgi:hypothetical protein
MEETMDATARWFLLVALCLGLLIGSAVSCGGDDDDDSGDDDNDDTDDDDTDDDDTDDDDTDDDDTDDDDTDDDDDTGTGDTALGLDGTSGYGATAENFSPPLNVTVTIEAWLYLDENPPAHLGTVVATGVEGGTAYAGFLLSYGDHTGVGELEFVYVFMVGAGKAVYSTSTLPVREWFHVAGTYDEQADDATACLYVNGVQEDCITHPEKAIQDDYPLYVGWDTWADDFFGGAINDLRISDEVRYTGDFTPPAIPLESDEDTISLYHFDEGTGSLAADAYGVNDLELSGGYSWDEVAK